VEQHLINQLLELAIQIQQVPAPTFDETLRGTFILQKLQAEGGPLTDIQTDTAGNVLARLPGSGLGPPLVISAHMDTVFPLNTMLTLSREHGRVYGAGIGDNSMGVAGLFGVMWALREHGIQLPGDIWFAANTGEEGLGDLRGMKAIVERFGATPKAYLILEGMALGHIYHKAVGVQRFKINIHTQGGHSWTDYGQPSAIHEISGLITEISSIKLPAHPHTTLNIGRISGGTSINTIAADAWLELDLRSEEQGSLSQLVAQVEKLAETVRKRGISMDMVSIGQRPSGEIHIEHPVIRLAQTCLREQGLEPVMTIGSTDANIPLSKGYPALVLGLTRGGGAHTIHEFIETQPIKQGLDHIVNFVNRLWG
jgi:acetylornithine deacetylase/succinyl-diaminopimelate desuccinylase-like protein